MNNALVVALVLGVTGFLLLPAVQTDNFGISIEPGEQLVVQDFADILTFTKAFWREGGGYDVERHLRVTSKWAGVPVQHAMPFGYPPTILWVMGPLTLLPTAWGYVVWTLFSLAAVWWMSGARQSIWMLMVFFTPVAFACFALGQTAILTLAGLLFLIRSRGGNQPCGDSFVRPSSEWPDVIVLWALTAKPPLALTAGVALLAARRWRVVVLAMGLTLVSTAALTPWLGSDWLWDYMHLVSQYDRQTAGKVFAWSLVPGTMGNLRALLSVTSGIGDFTASRVSACLWFVALGGILWGTFRYGLSVASAWGFSTLAFLLLFPHVTSTEELHVALVLALIVYADPPVRSGLLWATVGLVLVDLLLPARVGFYQGTLRLPIVCAVKVTLAVVLWATWAHARRLGVRGDQA